MFKKKIARKEWVNFEEVYKLLEMLKLKKSDFIEISGISSNTFYLWQRKGKIPASTLSVIKFEMLKYYENKHQENIKCILAKN